MISHKNLKKVKKIFENFFMYIFKKFELDSLIKIILQKSLNKRTPFLVPSPEASKRVTLFRGNSCSIWVTERGGKDVVTLIRNGSRYIRNGVAERERSKLI